jgi:hypothetical protein
MAEQVSAPGVDLHRVVRIVGSYVRHHQIAPDQLIRLIVEVHRRRISCPLEFAIRSPGDGTGLFAAPLGDGESAWVGPPAGSG